MRKAIVLLSIIVFLLYGCETGGESDEIEAEDAVLNEQGTAIEINEEYSGWNLTPKFKYQPKDQRKDEKVTYQVIGKKDGFGITGPFPIESRKRQKYFWFYWGEEPITNQPVKVMAHKKGSEKLITMYSGQFNEGAQINENEVNMPSTLKFPSSGVWNVLVYIDDTLSGNLVVKVVP